MKKRNQGRKKGREFESWQGGDGIDWRERSLKISHINPSVAEHRKCAWQSFQCNRWAKNQVEEGGKLKMINV